MCDFCNDLRDKYDFWGSMSSPFGDLICALDERSWDRNEPEVIKDKELWLTRREAVKLWNKGFVDEDEGSG